MKTGIPLFRPASCLALLSLLVSSAHAQTPPSADRLLWLRADAGTTLSDNFAVTQWFDQAGGVLNHATPYTLATPHLGTLTCANGPQPALVFTGNEGFLLANPAELRVPAVSVYVVGSLNVDAASEIFVANFSYDGTGPAGFAVGISDSVSDRLKWFTGGPAQALEPDGADLMVDTPYLITSTFADGNKEAYVNTNLVVSSSGQGLTYLGDSQLTIGTLNGGRQWLKGTIAEILIYSSVSPEQRQAVETYLNTKYFGLGTGPVVFTEQPRSQQVAELKPVILVAGVTGASPLTFQWQKDGVAIPGATELSYRIASATRNDAGQYKLLVTNPSGPLLSQAADLTVSSDNVAPTATAADSTIPTHVYVSFSEPVSAATATDTANYRLDNGVTVLAAAMGAGSSNVLLTTSPIAYGPTYTLTLKGIQDLVGNTMAANSTLAVRVPAPGQPTSVGQVLWFRADRGMTFGEELTVTAWQDQAPGANHVAKPYGAVVPQLGEVVCANGPQPAVNFNGAAGFLLTNTARLQLPALSVYLVGSVNQAAKEEVILANYSNVAGWALGISDSTPNRVKWFTANPGQTLEPDGADLNLDTPYLITGTFARGGTKDLFLNGSLAGETTGVSVSYLADAQLTLGTLNGGRQWFKGTIAEVLVYDSVSEAQREGVEYYLQKKYFGAGSGPVVFTVQPDSQTVAETKPMVLIAGVEGASPLSFQWTKDGTPIPGATTLSYRLASIVKTDAGQYRLQVTNPSGTFYSQTATLTVNGDNTPPMAVAASRNFSIPTQVWVAFSEPVAAASATDPAHYSINQGVTISAATLGASGSNVVLTTSALAYGPNYTLSINGVQDLVGNTMPPNSTIAVQVPAPITTQPPAADLVLWFNGHSGVSTTDGVLVSGWDDQATGGNPNNVQAIVGTPQVSEAVFPHGGLHQVIRFNGKSGLHLLGAEDADLPEFSLYVVGSIRDNSQASAIFISDWPGMALGISDTAPGVVKYVNANPVHSLEPAAARLQNDVPALLGMTFSAGTKTAYLNGNQVAQAAALSLVYGGGPLTVGMLTAAGGQFLSGDIAELLLYSSVSAEQRAAVEHYLAQKYFGGRFDWPLECLTIARTNATLTITWPSGTLQSAESLNGPWNDVTGATTPYVVSPTNAATFFRTRP